MWLFACATVRETHHQLKFPRYHISGQGGVRRFSKWVKTGPRGQEGGKEEVSGRGCPAADTSTGGDLFHAPETGMFIGKYFVIIVIIKEI